jgi:hypothetical protein
MTNALTFVVSCEVLGLQTPFVGSHWGHIMSKCTQYATDDVKVFTGLTFFPSRKPNPFCKKLKPEPKIARKGSKSGRRRAWIVVCYPKSSKL